MLLKVVNENWLKHRLNTLDIKKTRKHLRVSELIRLIFLYVLYLQDSQQLVSL